LLFGLSQLGIGGYLSAYWFHHLAFDARASGIVIDVSARGEGETVRVRFVTPSGEPAEFTDQVVDSEYDIGDAVPVLYEPENPTAAQIGFGKLWVIALLVPLLILLIGLLFSLGSIFEIRDRLRGIYE